MAKVRIELWISRFCHRLWIDRARNRPHAFWCFWFNLVLAAILVWFWILLQLWMSYLLNFYLLSEIVFKVINFRELLHRMLSLTHNVQLALNIRKMWRLYFSWTRWRSLYEGSIILAVLITGDRSLPITLRTRLTCRQTVVIWRSVSTNFGCFRSRLTRTSLFAQSLLVLLKFTSKFAYNFYNSCLNSTNFPTILNLDHDFDHILENFYSLFGHLQLIRRIAAVKSIQSTQSFTLSINWSSLSMLDFCTSLSTNLF